MKRITHMSLAALLFCALTYSIQSFETDEEMGTQTQLDMRSPKHIPGKAPSLRLYNAIIRYAETYDVPIHYAFAIAKHETGYRGPFHWKYNPHQTSPVGAVGPMQVMPATGDLVWKHKVSRDRLMNDIPFNVETSMKLLRILHDKYGDWKIVFGAYHTGRPCVDWYAIAVHDYEYQFDRP